MKVDFLPVITVCLHVAALLSNIVTTGALYAVTTFNSSKIANSTDWVLNTFPNPQKDVHHCGQDGRASNICDPDRLLERNTAVYMDEIIGEINQLKCPCEELGQHCPRGKGGYQIGIALAPSLELPSGVEDNELERTLQVQRFAQSLRTKQWDLGYCHNEAVVAIVANFNKVYTSTGSIAMNMLTAECVYIAESRALPYFQQGNYSAGLMVMLREFKTYFADENPCSIQGPKANIWPVEAILGCVIGGIAFMIVCIVTMTRFCTGAGASGASSHRHYYTTYNENQASFKKRPPEADIIDQALSVDDEECQIGRVKEIDV